MTNNPFFHPKFSSAQIEAAMPMTDRVSMLRALCDSEICGWHGRVIARTVLRSVAFRIVRETITRMEDDAVKSEEWIWGYCQGCSDAVAKQQDLCANAPKCPIKNRRIVMNKDPYMMKIIDEFGSYKKVPEVTP